MLLAAAGNIITTNNLWKNKNKKSGSCAVTSGSRQSEPTWEEIIAEAEKDKLGFVQYTLKLLKNEADHRQSKAEIRRTKAAGLPRNNNLDLYQTERNGLKGERLATTQGA
jgi:DNA replication protein DnaC